MYHLQLAVVHSNSNMVTITNPSTYGKGHTFWTQITHDYQHCWAKEQNTWLSTHLL